MAYLLLMEQFDRPQDFFPRDHITPLDDSGIAKTRKIRHVEITSGGYQNESRKNPERYQTQEEQRYPVPPPEKAFLLHDI
jgi:hypothetical protein